MTDDRVTSEGRADDPEGPTTGRLRVAGSAIPGNICRECGWSKVKCTCRSAKPPTKSQLRDYAQSQIKAHTAMLGFPRRYEVMVYSDKAHWDAGVAHHDYLYEATWPEAKKRIAANQVLDVFVYTEMTPDDTFGELNDVVTIDLARYARYGNGDPPASDRWLCRNRGGL